MKHLDRRTAIQSLVACPLVALASSRPSATALLRNEADRVDVRAFGGGDGDISAALRHAVALKKTAWIAAGRYTLSGNIDQGDVTIIAAPDAIIEATGEENVMFHSTGSFLRLPPPVGALIEGTSRIQFVREQQVQAGDWIVIYDPRDFSWHRSRAYYRAGEWCQVGTVQGRGLTLTKPLNGRYDPSVVQFYRVNLRQPALVGGRWKCGGRMLVHYTACTGALIDVEHIEAASNMAVYIDRCADAEVRCETGHNAGAGLDDYLICIGNSRSVRVTGDRLYSRRHPVAIGGGDLQCGVPCRDCSVIGVKLENDATSNVMCADIHGNADGCSYIQCDISGGISLGGASPTFRDCVVHARKDGTAAEATELVGGAISLTRVTILTEATRVGGGRGVIDIGTQNDAFNAGTRLDITLTLADVAIDAPRLMRDEAIVRIRNSGSRAKLNVQIDGVRLTLNQPVQFLRTERASGVAVSDFINVQNVSGLPGQSKLHFAVAGAYRESYGKRDKP